MNAAIVRLETTVNGDVIHVQLTVDRGGYEASEAMRDSVHKSLKYELGVAIVNRLKIDDRLTLRYKPEPTGEPGDSCEDCGKPDSAGGHYAGCIYEDERRHDTCVPVGDCGYVHGGDCP